MNWGWSPRSRVEVTASNAFPFITNKVIWCCKLRKDPTLGSLYSGGSGKLRCVKHPQITLWNLFERGCYVELIMWCGFSSTILGTLPPHMHINDLHTCHQHTPKNAGPLFASSFWGASTPPHTHTGQPFASPLASQNTHTCRVKVWLVEVKRAMVARFGHTISSKRDT